MTQSNLISDFSKFHLGGRVAPADLRVLLEMQWSAGGASDALRIRFLAGDRTPAQVAAEFLVEPTSPAWSGLRALKQ